jgi:hypothetical protein
MINRLRTSGVSAFDLLELTAPSVSRMIKGNLNVVIVMMNNSSQISKINTLFNRIRVLVKVKRNYFFHDEADTLSKTDTSFEISESSVAISHREWALFFENVSKSKVPTTRFWISATPENCSSIARVTGGRIIVLPSVENYRGVSDNVNWSGDSECLKNEIDRIRILDNGEVILYCVEKRVADQDGSAKEISRNYGCVCLSYNGKSAVLYKCGAVVSGLICSDDSVSSILDRTRELCSGYPMVIVGFLLMNRGVSFVGSGINPPTATVMFYRGGGGAHMVGIAQRFGRITGTSRPDLNRRVVYCSSGVYTDYCNYLSNQQLAFRNLEGGGTLCEILKREGGIKLGRDIDRITLKQVNLEFGSIGNGVVRGDRVDMDLDKMARLVDSWRGSRNGTAVARLFRRMLENGGKLLSCNVRTFFNTEGPYNALTNGHTSDHSLVFRKDSTFHYLRDEVADYLA